MFFVLFVCCFNFIGHISYCNVCVCALRRKLIIYTESGSQKCESRCENQKHERKEGRKVEKKERNKEKKQRQKERKN